MAELPTALPTSDLSFATAGTKTESSPTDKTDGFVIGDYPDEEVVNYRWDGEKQHIDWLEAVRPRVFTDMVEAIDETSPMDLIVWGGDQSWDDGDVLKAAAGALDLIASDGRRIYYTIGTTLYAATASATTTADVEWSIDTTMAEISQLSTDGAIVAVLAPTFLKVYNAVTGALIASVAWPGTLASELTGMLCDTDSSDYRVWIGTTYLGGKWYEWTLAGGLVQRGSLAGTITMTQSSVIDWGPSNINSLDKTNFGVVGNVNASAIQRQVDWAFGRDDRVAYGGFPLVAPAGDRLVNNGRVAEPTGVTPLSADPPAIWGDGRLFTSQYVIDERGIVEHLFATPLTDPVAFSGQYLFTDDGGGFIRVRPVKIKKGSLWLRKSDGTDGNFNGRSESGLRLMTRVLW